MPFQLPLIDQSPAAPELPEAPESRFGVTRKRYDLTPFEGIRPNVELLAAANQLNETRFQRLTHRQRVFVDSYLANDFNGELAAQAAGYSEDEAARVSRKLLKKEYIQEAINAALVYFTEREKVRFERVVDELKLLAFSNMGDFWRNDGTGDPYLVMPEDGDPKMRAVSEIQVDSYFEGKGETKREVKRIKFKLHDKNSAIDKLIRILDPAKSGDAQPSQTNVAVSVQSINIVPVPQGQFIQAPPSPYDQPIKTIEHEP